MKAFLSVGLFLALAVCADAAVIRATAARGGTIVPAGAVSVSAGLDQAFVITPALGRTIQAVRVDRRSVGAVTSYTFTNVTAPHSIQALFGYQTFTVAVSAGSHGRMLPARTMQARFGSTKQFTATPSRGYRAALKVDGRLVAATLKGVVRFALTNIQGPHTVEAVFVPLGSSFADSFDLTPIGLGQTIRVAVESPGAFHGFAGSDLGILAVRYSNELSHAQGVAAGTTNWSAAVPLAEGDNRIHFRAEAGDHSFAEAITTVTYYPALDFTTPLTPSRTIFYTNESAPVIFTIGLANSSNAVVEVFQTDSNGVLQGAGLTLRDEGAAGGNEPDQIAGDGVFTGMEGVDTTMEGALNYRAKVIKGTNVYYSEVITLLVLKHLSNAAVSNAVNVADTAQQRFNQLVAGGTSPADAGKAVLAELRANAIIGAIGSGSAAEVWWVTTNGLLGAFVPSLDGQKAGTSGGMSAPAIESADVPVVKHYTAKDAATLNQSTQPQASADDAVGNRIRSKKAIIVSPFINNSGDIANSLGTADDFYKPWQRIRNAGASACQLYAAREATNNGAVSFSLDAFKALSDYGYIHISSHGANLYNHLLSQWNAAWGPSDFLRGASSQSLIFTGLKLPRNGDGTFDVTGYEDDLNAKRLALGPDGSLLLLPYFFSTYLDTLPNSLVVLSACASTRNSSLASAFLGHGAGAVIGYTDYVKTSYSQDTLDAVIAGMYAGKTLIEAINTTVSTYGATDGDSTPASLTEYGADTLLFPGEDLLNAGFEDAGLTPWTKNGGADIISQLGSARPTEGDFMGIISTGGTNELGSLEQDFCVPDNATTLTFDWNFFSEEFFDGCGTAYQDSFTVNLCEIHDDGTGDCAEPFRTQIDLLCGSTTPANIGFDKGHVSTTGWQSRTIDLTAYQGKHLRVRFIVADGGNDSQGDTAVLLDNIVIHTQ